MTDTVKAHKLSKELLLNILQQQRNITNLFHEGPPQQQKPSKGTKHLIQEKIRQVDQEGARPKRRFKQLNVNTVTQMCKYPNEHDTFS